MPKIISVHSFRGGTGKSNLTANLAAGLAGHGQRVGVVDTDIQSPGIHVLFGVTGDEVTTSLNDYLWHGSSIKDTAMDVTPAGLAGKVFLIPSSTKPGEITRALRQGYDARRMTAGFRDLLAALQLDTLLIDTHPGLNEETLLSLVISHSVIVVMRPDHQDYEGTGIAIKVASSLKVPNLVLVVNKAPGNLEPGMLAQRLGDLYGVEVLAVLPHSETMMELGSEGIFSLKFPEHPLADQYRAISDRFVGPVP